MRLVLFQYFLEFTRIMRVNLFSRGILLNESTVHNANLRLVNDTSHFAVNPSVTLDILRGTHAGLSVTQYATFLTGVRTLCRLYRYRLAGTHPFFRPFFYKVLLIILALH